MLWSFNGADGSQPYGSLIMDKSGNLYGTTANGGSNGGGVVFEVTP
ncbi:MAG: choice-of-anchor tandem repeat GloVer-containing protein [Terriglobales bacterium]